MDACAPETGSCGSVAVDCDDGDACTEDACVPATGACVHDSLACDDSDLCTTDACHPATGDCVHEAVVCDDGDPCSVDACAPETGSCGSVAVDCDDGDACTEDACVPATGACVYDSVVCDDSDLCTADACDPATGDCVHEAVVCDDGDPCSVDACAPETGSCGSVAVDCDDGDACTEDACVPATGACVHDSVVCDDSDLCTTDACDPETGLCVGEAICEDGNVCTEDACDPATGACAQTAWDCDDSDPCTLDSCDDALQVCVHDDVCPCGLLGLPCPDGFSCEPGHQEGWDYCWAAEDDSVWVPSGVFWMGCDESTPNDSCSYAEDPAHEVYVAGFAIHRTEITGSDFETCMAAGCVQSCTGTAAGTGERPAECVDWYEAEAYCEWLAQVDGKPWRLCSEAEWEKAARGGCETVTADSPLGCPAGMRVYPWSAPGETYWDAPATCLHAWMFESGGPGCDMGYATTVADSMPQGASPYGALHMAGNALEWVADCRHEGGYWPDPPGSGWPPWVEPCPNPDIRMTRGGDFDSQPGVLRAASRNAGSATFASWGDGFRCCRPME